MKRSLFNATLFSALTCSIPVLAQGAAKPKTPSKTAPKIDLGLPNFGPPPKVEVAPKSAPEAAPAPAAEVKSEKHQIVRVLNGVGWSDSAEGRRPSVEYKKVQLGVGGVAPRFSTVVRVRHAKAKGIGIQIEVTDPRGNVVMETQGQVTFRKGSTEADWQVDWDPTPFRIPGTCQMSVRLGDAEPVAFPLEVVPG